MGGAMSSLGSTPRQRRNKVHPAPREDQAAEAALAVPLLEADHASRAAATTVEDPVADRDRLVEQAEPEEEGWVTVRPTARSAARARPAAHQPVPGPPVATGLPGLLHRLAAALAAAWRRLLDALAGWLGAARAARQVAPTPVGPLSPLQQQRLAELQQRVNVPYDPRCEAHAAALRMLWEAGFPGSPFPTGVKAPMWKVGGGWRRAGGAGLVAQHLGLSCVRCG